jgi:uncharacterized protein YciI
MYAIAIVRYVKPLDEVLKHVDLHRAYLRDLAAKGTLLASGPLEPRYGGALLLRIPDAPAGAYATLAALRDGDPFVKAQVAQYELLPWLPNIGVEGLDKL